MTHESKMGQSGHSVVTVDELNAKLATEKSTQNIQLGIGSTLLRGG